MAEVTGSKENQASNGGIGEWEAEEQLHAIDDGVGQLFGSSQKEEEVRDESHISLELTERSIFDHRFRLYFLEHFLLGQSWSIH